jgi:hypothetical protein
MLTWRSGSKRSPANSYEIRRAWDRRPFWLMAPRRREDCSGGSLPFFSHNWPKLSTPPGACSADTRQHFEKPFDAGDNNRSASAMTARRWTIPSRSTFGPSRALIGD